MNPQEDENQSTTMILESPYWQGYRLSSGWDMHPPDEDYPCQITQFDDGNQQYQEYPNNWLVYGSWKGKVALVNNFHREITINSISLWKTRII